MPIRVCSMARRAMLGVAVALALGAASAQATPYLVVDADSDQVLMENEATAPWYPASLTKLMTVYVALDAVRNGKLTLDTPLIMSARAARMPPSKMGFRPGTEVTLDNALKMLMVKSPNDVAVMVAEGVSGSVEAFADDMNAAAQRLGMHESHFVNPNGLHNPAHVSSARDMAIVARALLHEFPDHADLFSIGALQLGNQYIPNHNGSAWPLSRRRRDEDGLYLSGGFQRRGERQPLRTAVDRGRARRANRKIAQSGSGEPFRPRLRHGGRQRLAGIAALGFRPPARYARRRLPASQCGPHRRRRGGGRRRPVPGSGRIRQPRGSVPNPFAALLAPVAIAHTELSDGRIRFDPVPVYIGPAPGWKGPALGARPTGAVAATGSAGVKTISVEGTSALADRQEGDAGAPTQPSSKSKLKFARHSHRRIAAHKPAKAAAEKSVKKDANNGLSVNFVPQRTQSRRINLFTCS